MHCNDSTYHPRFGTWSTLRTFVYVSLLLNMQWQHPLRSLTPLLRRMFCDIRWRIGFRSNVRLHWGFLQPWETVACQDPLIKPGNFQFSTLCSLCKGSNFGSYKITWWPHYSTAFTAFGATSWSFQREVEDWNSVRIAVFHRMVLRSRTSERVMVMLLVSLALAEGAPSLDRDLLANQVCQFQVTCLGQSHMCMGYTYYMCDNVHIMWPPGG